MSIKNINNDSKPHFVLVPLMAQGHMIPMVDIARLLADRGAHISFITTPVNATRVKPVIENSKSKNQNQSIDIIELNFPCEEFGLPKGCENVDLITSVEHYKPFFKAANALNDQLKAYIQYAKPRATCILSDYCNSFTAEVGQSLDVPRIIFHGPSCMFIHGVYSIRKHGLYDGKGENDVIVVPDLPKKIEVTKAQAPGWFSGDDWEEIRKKAAEAEASAVGIVMNTFYELEAEIIDRYEMSIGKRVWPIGPLCLYDKDVDSKANRGKKSYVDRVRVLNWLDSKEPKSVLYVSFGSLVRMKTPQLIEIGVGLENSNIPFIWVIKEAERTEEFDKWMSEGFEERTKERGLVITGWAPQVVILPHCGIGGFMTHCGWNSMLEAISAGIPMLTWPHFADQFLNEKLIVEVIETGVAVGVQKPYYNYAEDEEPVKGEVIEKAVLRLMDKGKEGDDRRMRAMEYGEKARKAMEGGGSSCRNLTSFMEYIVEGAKN